MKLLVYFLATLILIFFVSGWLLSLASRKNAHVEGVVNGKLTACPATPNCFCSDYTQQRYSVAPLDYTGDAKTAWMHAQSAIAMTGGEITHVSDHYLAATYTSRVFRFIDDVEMRLDSESQNIHIRSASRVGYSDFGANRQRVERIRNAFSELMASP